MTRTIALATAVVALSLAACGSDDTDSAGSTGDHNDTDVAFAQQMIPHHAQAVDMSDIVLAKDGVDARVADLAEEIKAAQTPEIDVMAGWLSDWDEEVPPTAGTQDMGGMEMDGMMSAEDMTDLEEADADRASRLFLGQMTEHHVGAIDTAEQEVDGGSYPEAIDLAETIIETQQAEITRMEELLRTL